MTSEAPSTAAPSDPAGYEWRLTEDPAYFHDRARGFLGAAPALNTVLLTVADAVRRRGPDAFGAGTPHYGVLLCGEEVCGAFLRTPPHGVLLSPLLPTPATEALAALLAAGHPGLSGVSSDTVTAGDFAAAWSRRTGAAARVRTHERLYRLETLTLPEPLPPGRARTATDADRELLARWYVEFGEAIGARGGMDPDAWAESRVSYGGVTLWELPDGTPAAMAGTTHRIAGQARVAPVYTPVSLRGRGYAGAATAEISRALRAAGTEEILLFTDLANPTSNGLYQRLGYRAVRDFDVLEFAPAGGSKGPGA